MPFSVRCRASDAISRYATLLLLVGLTLAIATGCAGLSCPPDAANCASVSGRILYVEAVDPDGDGDAHFALISRESITLPGISVVDVGLGIRPRRLPEPGDYMSAIGPVYQGSHGQRQVEATQIRIWRRKR